MYKTYTVGLVFPAYNEADNIYQAITDFQQPGVIDEIIVVDNNSNDQTAKLAKQAGAKVVTEKKQGYGFALQKGLKTAHSDLVILAEPDGTFTAQDLPRILRLLTKYDCVLGTRTNQRYIQPGAHMSGLLRWGNILVARYLSFLYGLPPLSDCGCTFRGFRAKVVRQIVPHLTVGESHFLPETVILTALFGYRLTEIPIHYQPRIGQSKITGSMRKSIQVGWNMWWLITRSLWQKK